MTFFITQIITYKGEQNQTNEKTHIQTTSRRNNLSTVTSLCNLLQQVGYFQNTPCLFACSYANGKPTYCHLALLAYSYVCSLVLALYMSIWATA